MDIFLLLMLLVLLGVFLIVDIKLLFHYEHPDDKNTLRAFICKIFVLLGLLLSQLLVILLPMDVYNSRPSIAASIGTVTDVQRPGGFMMDIFWLIIYLFAFVWLVILWPFATAYYSADDDVRVTKKHPIVVGLIRMAIVFVIVAVVLTPLYFWLGQATIPFYNIICSGNVFDNNNNENNNIICNDKVENNINYMIRFDIYLVGCMCFVGWFFFILFGGLGLSSVPIDLIISFIDRPNAITLSAYNDRKKLLGEEAVTLGQVGYSLKTRDNQLKESKGLSWADTRKKESLRKDYNKFKQSVYMLEREVALIEISHKQKGQNPVVSVFKLILGIFSSIISLLWLLHIILFIVIRTGDPPVPVSTFLNGILDAMDSTGILIMSLVVYGLLIIYLMICVIKGCFKLGMRIFILFPIHPMERKNTPVDTFLFNTALLVLSSTAVIQFAQTAFADYSRLTDAELIFSAQIRHMTLLGWIYSNQIFVYVLLGWTLLCTIYLLIRPRDKGAKFKDFKHSTESEQLEANRMAEKEARKTTKEKEKKKKEEDSKNTKTIGKRIDDQMKQALNMCDPKANPLTAAKFLV
eukprot:GHVR01162879.1.p1 GENE.GHVR01162879.1~~GHVR01162879.1.p1  ORF type:complete len:578 (+),score=131.18 GHVR01162879.1:43-1776(+)